MTDIDTTYIDLADSIIRASTGCVLDIPAGKGDLSKELLLRGVSDLTCVDILPESEFKLAGQVKYQRADINDPLPFEDGCFDCVVSREGIEHLVTPFAFLSELCRVVRPGGSLFLTTPNVMTVDSRMKFLMSGYFQGFRELRDNHSGLRKLEFQGHISPIYYWQLSYFLENYGFSIERISTNAIKSESKPMKRLLVWLIGKLIRSSTRRRGFSDEGTLSDEFLFGDSLIIQARRTGARVTCHGQKF